MKLSEKTRQRHRAKLASQRVHNVVIDLGRTATAFPHFWEHSFGSCHAPVTLFEDWRNDLRKLKSAVDLQYIRFHGIFDREIGLFEGVDAAGDLRLNWTRVDLVYDGLVRNGVRPFVELSFMPPAMAQDVEESAHPFHYRQNVAPARDPVIWYKLIHAFTSHMVERYGLAEVRQWLFEVWNEPNIDFLAGDAEHKMARYFEMYDLAAHAVKDVSSDLKVGGPSSAGAKWIPEFIEHCATSNVPVDFVSTHVYPHEEPRNVLGPEFAGATQKNMVGRAARLVFDQVKSSKLPDLAIYWSEYNAGFDPHLWQLDSAYVGPWLAETISACDGLVTELAYWTFTDCGFEELGVLKGVFGTGFGLIAAGGIPKAPFNVFKILHLLGEQRIRDIGCDAALATIRSDGTIVAAVWNYVAPDQSGGGDSKTFRILLERTECRLACVHVVDADHGNPLKAWEAMGRPAYPSLAQQRQLRLAGELAAAQVVELKHKKELTVTVAPHGLVVIELIK